MKKILVSLVLLFAIVGCGRGVEVGVNGEPILLAQLDELRAVLAQSGHTIPRVSVVFEDVPPSTEAARCDRPFLGNRQIVINKPFWDSVATTTRKVILLHEIGHCLLGRSHNDGAHEDGRVKSVMHSKAPAFCDFESDPSGYIAELFQP